MNAWGIVVAAGQGARFGAPINKVYLPLMGRCVLAHTLAALERAGCLAGLVVVFAQGEEDLARQAAQGIGLPMRFVQGAAQRMHSVHNGLRALPPQADYALVHDGARPLVAPDLIRACLMSAKEKGSGVAAAPVTDTIKQVGEGEVVGKTLPREQLWAAKTPQCFPMPALLRWYDAAIAQGVQATDDAQIAEMAGEKVHLVPCGPENIKITTPQDIAMVRGLMGGSTMRIGSGYDVHRLVQGRKLVLCGIEIPHEAGLDGHSDADVAVHALIDALLGACAMGDIGHIFPDTDAQHKGANSMLFLQKVLSAMAQKGYAPQQIDITIQAQRPKLAPYNVAMRAALAKALALPLDCVSVKATTTEGLGFVGREEGIAAQAMAIVRVD